MSDAQIGNKKRQYQKINNILIMDGDHENKTKVNMWWYSGKKKENLADSSTRIQTETAALNSC